MLPSRLARVCHLTSPRPEHPWGQHDAVGLESRRICSTVTDYDLARRFLANLYGEVVDDGGLFLAIWSLQDKRTRTFQDTSEAAEYAIEKADAGMDVYHGVCPMSTPPVSGRGTIGNIGAVSHLWLDLDVVSDAHKAQKNYCPSIELAIKWLKNLSTPPSVIIHSGHGLQAYWMLTNPIIIRDEVDRTWAGAITAGWVDQVRLACKWELDSVGDIARVFRIPGTINAKGDPVVPVVMLSHTWRQYDLNELLQVVPHKDAIRELVKEKKQSKRNNSPGAGELYPVGDPSIPLAVVKLCEIDRKFKKTWEKKNSKFSSASEYDMSICSQLVIAEAEDQVIANSLHAWRAMHGEDVDKLFRKPGPNGTYVQALIDKCRATITYCKSYGHDDQIDEFVQHSGDLIAANAEHEKAKLTQQITPRQYKDNPGTTPPAAKDNLEERSGPPGGMTPEQAAEAAKQKTLQEISKRLGLNILQIIQTGIENPTFNWVIRNGHGDIRAHIGGAEALLSPRSVRTALIGHHIMLPPIKDVQWQALIRMMFGVTEVRQSDSSVDDEFSDIVSTYLQHQSPVPWDERAEAIENGLPFLSRDGREVAIFLKSLLKFTNSRLLMGERVKHQDLRNGLSTIGFQCRQAAINKTGLKRQCRMYWFGELAMYVDEQ